MTDYAAQVTAIVQELSRLPHLEPERVAGLLKRRLRLLDENDYLLQYQLVGGMCVPVDRIEVRWGKNHPGGFLHASIAEGIRLPIPDMQKPWEELPMAFIPPSPRNPDGSFLYVYKSPLGELRFAFRDFDENYFLSAFVLDESPLVDWEGEEEPAEEAAEE